MLHTREKGRQWLEKRIEFYLLGSSDYVWFPAFALSFCIASIILTIRKNKRLQGLLSFSDQLEGDYGYQDVKDTMK